MDKVILENLRFDLKVGFDAWRRFDKPQPTIITLEIQPETNFEAAAAQDNVNLTLDYGALSKRITASLQPPEDKFPTVHALISRLHNEIDFSKLDIDILFPKALLQVDGGVLYRCQVDNSGPGVATSTLTATIKQIACRCIVGVNPHERLYSQAIFIDVTIFLLTAAVGSEPPEEPYTVSLHDMVREIVDKVDGSAYHTIEALATAVAQIVTMNYGHKYATVRVRKPSAIATIGAAAVEITRTKAFFEGKDFWKVKRP